MKETEKVSTYLIQQFLLGNLSIYEEKKLLEWIDRSPENKQLFIKTQQNLRQEVCNATNNEIYNTQWQLIKQKIESSDQRKPFKSRFLNLPLIIGIAASLFVGTIFYVLIESNSNSKNTIATLTVETIAGEKSTVTLPDGTTVFLNSETQISYPEHFSEKNRTVELEGEAFFDVSHNSAKPFIVSAGDISIRVLGTTFNLRAFADEETISTTLVEGKVRIEKENEKEQTVLADLNPSERAVFSKNNNKITVSYETNLNKFIGWKEGKLVLDNAPVEVVVKKLEAWFNVKIIVKGEQLKKTRFTMTFTDETIEEVLKLLALSYPVQYTIKETNKDDNTNKNIPKLEITLNSKK